jgi:hypothetical protein
MSSSNVGMAALCVVVMMSLAGCGGGSNSSSSGGGGGGGGGQSPTTVTYTFTGGAPIAVASQIGAGAYAAATLQSSKLTLSIPNGTTDYAVAFACPSTAFIANFSSNEEFVVQRSVLDGTSFTELCPNPNPPQVDLESVQVDASAIPGASFVGITTEGVAAPLPWLGSTLSVSFPMVTGTADVFVVAYDSTGLYPLAIRVLRAQTIPGALNGGNTVVFTVNDETSKQAITYDNLPPGSSPLEVPQVTYYTSGGQYFELQVSDTALPDTQYPAMPAGAVQTGDYYTFFSSAPGGVSAGTVGFELATSQGGAQTITYPAPWTYSGPTAAALPTFNFSYTGFSGSQFVLETAAIEWVLGATPANPIGTSYNSIQVSATQNYQNGATTLTIPNLSGVTGFSPSPPSGAGVDWDAEITEGAGFQTTPPSGTVQGVVNSGTFTAP